MNNISPSSNVLLPAEIYVVTTTRGMGEGIDSVVDLNNDVYNNMGQRPRETVCARTQQDGPWEDVECSSKWGWQIHNCTDMLPFKIAEHEMSGQFYQVSNEAKNRGMRVGTRYTITFTDTCSYNISFVGCESERGFYTYTRASDYSLTNGGGGNYRYAHIKFYPVGCDNKPWKAFVLARELYEGILETAFGTCSFKLDPY